MSAPTTIDSLKSQAAALLPKNGAALIDAEIMQEVITLLIDFFNSTTVTSAISTHISTKNLHLTSEGISNANLYHAGNLNQSSIDFVAKDITASGKMYATDFQIPSDKRLKENIQTIPDALSVVLKLRGVLWTWKSNGKASTGFIADEIRELIPELVSEIGPEKLLSVNYQILAGYLVEAIKEQNKAVVALQQTVQSLDTRLKALEKKE